MLEISQWLILESCYWHHSPYVKKKNQLNQILANNLKRYRASNGETQATLAEKAEVSIVYLAELEIGRKNPSLEVIERLANALNIRPYELFLEEGRDSNPDQAAEAVRTFVADITERLAHVVPQTIHEALNKAKK